MKKSVFKGKLGNSIKATLMSGAVLFTTLFGVAAITDAKSSAFDVEKFLKQQDEYLAQSNKLIDKHIKMYNLAYDWYFKACEGINNEFRKKHEGNEKDHEILSYEKKRKDIITNYLRDVELEKIDAIYKKADKAIHTCFYGDVNDKSKCYEDVFNNAKNGFSRVLKKTARKMFDLLDDKFVNKGLLEERVANYPLPGVDSNGNFVTHLETPVHSGKELAEYPLVKQ